MDASRLPRKIGIHGANDDSGVLWLYAVKVDKVLAVERQHGTTVCDGKIQHGLVRPRLSDPAGFGGCQHVVAQSAEFVDYRPRKVLVPVQPNHPSCFLVGPNLLVDLVTVQSDVRPGSGQVIGTQGWIAAQEIGFACSEAAGLL
jgi:hypothetical protein